MRRRDLIGGAAGMLLLSGTAWAKDKKTVRRVLGHGNGQLTIWNEATKSIEWQMPCGGVAHDIAMLSNGNILAQTSSRNVVEISLDKKIVWQWDGKPKPPYEGRVEIHAFERLKNGTTLISETGNKRILIVDASGKILSETPLTIDKPDSHRDTRRVRMTPNGNFLVCHENDGTVREYEKSGKVVWSYKLDLMGQPRTPNHDGHGVEVFNAIRLKNGRTLIGGGNNNRVFEVDKQGKTTWSVERDELPGIHLCWVTDVQPMPNGNVVFGNTHAGENQPVMIEVTRDKKVVWTLQNWPLWGNDLAASVVVDSTV